MSYWPFGRAHNETSSKRPHHSGRYRALAEAASLPPEPLAVSVQYDTRLALIILHLNTGRRLAIPRENLQGLENATEEQIAQIEIFGGLDIAWPQLDLDHYLPALVEGISGSDKWMQNLEREESQLSVASWDLRPRVISR